MLFNKSRNHSGKILKGSIPPFVLSPRSNGITELDDGSPSVPGSFLSSILKFSYTPLIISVTTFFELIKSGSIFANERLTIMSSESISIEVLDSIIATFRSLRPLWPEESLSGESKKTDEKILQIIHKKTGGLTGKVKDILHAVLLNERANALIAINNAKNLDIKSCVKLLKKLEHKKDSIKIAYQLAELYANKESLDANEKIMLTIINYFRKVVDIIDERVFNYHWDNETDEYWKFIQGLADKVKLEDCVKANSVADLLK